MSYYGENIRLNIFGSSHSEVIGMSLEGIPSGLAVDIDKLQQFMRRRAPGRNAYSSARREEDKVEFQSGIENSITTGKTIRAIIRNTDLKSRDYDSIKYIPRPGHADYPAWVKYGDEYKHHGGGQFSGRMTAPMCIAGAICLQLLSREGIEIISRISSIENICDSGELLCSLADKEFPTVSQAQGTKMLDRIMCAKAEGDSVGGVVECKVLNLPVGIGGAMFQGLESRIASAVFGIPALKGLEFGAGFKAALMRGSENNDQFCIRNGRIETVTNNCGGILGGMSDSMPVIFRAAFKPTPSIAKKQKSVNLKTMTETEIEISGRHDPCVVPRAAVCVEAAAALAIYDACLDKDNRWIS